MLKVLLNKENNKGFSLIELLLVIAIMGLIVTAASYLFVSGYNFYNQNKEKTKIQSEVRFITQYIDERVKFTENITLQTSAPTSISANEVGMGVENNIFYVYESTGKRQLSDVNIQSINFNYNNDNLSYSIITEDGDFQVDTKVILNNKPDSTNNNGNYIIVDK